MTTTTDLFDEATLARTAAKVQNLSAEHIDITPISYDWSEGYGETWVAWEAIECDECGTIIVEGDDHVAVVPDDDDDGECPNAGQGASELGAEGPMMNYYYPMSFRHPEDAARRIAHLPLCVVCPEWNGDGPEGLALTGGGMDLSWEIAEAFISLGFLPPVHFANLPGMAGKSLTENNLLIVSAMGRSLELMEGRMSSDRERLNSLVERMAAETKERIAAGSPIYG